MTWVFLKKIFAYTHILGCVQGKRRENGIYRKMVGKYPGGKLAKGIFWKLLHIYPSKSRQNRKNMEN